MVTITLHTWLVVLLLAVALMYTVYVPLKILHHYYAVRSMLKIGRRLAKLEEATKDPQLKKACAYTVYQIGKAFENYKHMR